MPMRLSHSTICLHGTDTPVPGRISACPPEHELLSVNDPCIYCLFAPFFFRGQLLLRAIFRLEAQEGSNNNGEACTLASARADYDGSSREVQRTAREA